MYTALRQTAKKNVPLEASKNDHKSDAYPLDASKRSQIRRVPIRRVKNDPKADAYPLDTSVSTIIITIRTSRAGRPGRQVPPPSLLSAHAGG